MLFRDWFDELVDNFYLPSLTDWFDELVDNFYLPSFIEVLFKDWFDELVDNFSWDLLYSIDPESGWNDTPPAPSIKK